MTSRRGSVNTRLKALMISPFRPDRTGSGAQQRAATLLEALRCGADVTLWVLRGDVPGSDLPTDVKVVNFPRSGPTAKRFARGWAERASRDSIAQDLSGLEDIGRFDLCVCFRLQSAVFLERMERVIGRLAKRRIVDFDDVESTLLQRQQTLFRPSRARQSAKAARQVRLTRRVEDRCLASYELVLVASPKDLIALRARDEGATVALAPNGVAFPQAERSPLHHGQLVITFVGNFGYAANVDAIAWFARRVMPTLVRCADCDFRVDVVGYNSHRLPRSLRHTRRINVVGSVMSLTRTYSDTSLVIAPVRVGSGTRMKILEAMSHATAVVSTSVGAEGLEAAAGEHLIVADGAIPFARACAELLSDLRLRRRIGSQARSLVRSRYALDVVLPELTKLIFSPGFDQVSRASLSGPSSSRDG